MFLRPERLAIILVITTLSLIGLHFTGAIYNACEYYLALKVSQTDGTALRGSLVIGGTDSSGFGVYATAPCPAPYYYTDSALIKPKFNGTDGTTHSRKLVTMIIDAKNPTEKDLQLIRVATYFMSEVPKVTEGCLIMVAGSIGVRLKIYGNKESIGNLLLKAHKLEPKFVRTDGTTYYSMPFPDEFDAPKNTKGGD